jgi:hypothetical protein
MKYRLLALVPCLLLAVPVWGQVLRPGSVYPGMVTPRQRITDFTGEVTPAPTIRIDDVQWSGVIRPYPLRVTEQLIGRSRITEINPTPKLQAPPAMPKIIVPVNPQRQGATIPTTPTAHTLKVSRWLGQMGFDDVAGFRWELISGSTSRELASELSGWLLPNTAQVPHFYAHDGRLFRVMPGKM